MNDPQSLQQEARERLDDLRKALQRRGKDVAAIVSLDDLALLEALEDRKDVKAAREVLAEMKRKGQKPTSWEKVKEELGLTAPAAKSVDAIRGKMSRRK